MGKMSKDQCAELLAAIVRSAPRDMDSDVAQGWITNQGALARVLKEALAPPVKAIAKTWRELFDACRQDYCNKYFNEKNFPLEPVAADEGEWEVYEHHFLEVVTGEVAFRRLEEMGYRLCGPRRAMEYIAEHLELQLDHLIVVTALWPLGCGDWAVPVFSGPSGRRDMSLSGLDDKFNPLHGWLVLRRKQTK
jgi:hypothetical protein